MAISLLVQIFVITTLFFPTISKTTVTQCLEHEKTLLLELKKELVLFDSSKSTKLVQWNKRDGECCRWKGVECDGAGRVISLQLDSEAISGGLNDSSSLFNLEYLEKLNLAYNDMELGTQIPRGIEKLTYLTHLNLSSAGFGGKVPIEFSHVMRRLVSLDLSRNEQIEPLSLMVLFHNLTKLRELYLDGMNLSSLGIHVIASSTPRLTTLSLIECSLSGPLDHSLSQLHSLSVLRLDYNNLSTVVPDFFANFSSLTTLSLIDCNLNGYFPEKIFQIPTLQNLDLSDNVFLSGTIPQFPHTTSLRTILLTGTKFSGSLPDSISNLKYLSVLDLSSCQFIGSISSIHFEGLSHLVSIDLCNNSLTGSIPTSIFALPSLQTLDFSENQFSGQVNEFPVINISNLVKLDLSRNRLEGPIPISFFRLQSPQYLRLSNNSFSDSFQLENIVSLRCLISVDLSGNNLSLDTTGIRSISKNFPDLVKPSTLRHLDLSNNKFAGEIPSWIWEIGNGKLIYLNLSCNMFVDLQKPYNIPTPLYLLSLDLHSNQLRGELPLLLLHAGYVDCSNNYFDKFITDNGNYFSAPNLVYLSLANNSISGSFPTFLCTSSLIILDLSVNKLSGSIPPCIFENNGNLEVFSFRRNNISGRIPDNFSQDCNLKTLDLSNNNLFGRVPRSLGNCKFLEVMNVGTNHIDDIFPCMLPSSLLILVLHSNRFHGEVRCLGSWPNLQIIDIASNNLSGYLNSSSFTHWRGMVQGSNATTAGNLGVHIGSGVSYYYPDNTQISRGNLGVDTDRVAYSFDDEVTLIIKGLELKLVKIWTQFTAIDFSCNNFHGDIPDAIGELNALYLS